VDAKRKKLLNSSFNLNCSSLIIKKYNKLENEKAGLKDKRKRFAYFDWLVYVLKLSYSLIDLLRSK
jgi:hypothetical protein